MTFIPNFPSLGVGLGYRSNLISEIFLHQNEIDFLEIIAEHYLDATPEKIEELELLLQHFTVIPHGIQLSIGSAEGIDLGYLDKLASLIEKIKPPYWSEHLSFTQAGTIDIGHLSPLPFNQEAIDIVSKNIEIIRKTIDTPLILENITYLIDFPNQEMNEAEFITKIAEETNCGLLLDITNLHTNATNFGYDPNIFLEQIPLEKVVQLHFVGGYWQQDLLIDSHSHPTPPEVWELMEKVSAQTTSLKGILLERDENFPPFSELVKELKKARMIGNQHHIWA